MEVSSLGKTVAGQVDLQRMAGPATFTLAAQAFRVVATMLLTVLVSRVLGAEALGLLTVGLTLATSATIVACLGVDQGIIYFVARTHPASPRAAPATDVPASSAVAAIRSALIITSAGGLIVGLLAWLAAPLAADLVFDEPDLAAVLLIFAPSVAFAAPLAAALGALQGSFRLVHRAVIEWIAFPLLALVLAVAAMQSGMGVNGVAGAFFAAWAGVAIVAIAMATRIPGQRGPLIIRPMLAFSMPLMLSLLTGYLLFHVDVLMLGGLAGIREVGLYSAATRLALPLFLVLDSVARAFAPMVAQLFSQGHIERLAPVYAGATEWIIAINVPAGIVIAMNAEALLGIFGAEFVPAATALRVLCLGIVAATSCGAAASVLTMTRWQRLEMFDNLLLLATNIVLNFVLVPRFGALGAAIATAVSAGSVFALKLLQARWLTGVQPFRVRQLAVPALAALAAAVSWFATQPFSMPPLMVLAARVIVFGVTYGVLWWRWGCSDSSREVLRAALRRPATGEIA